MTVTSLGPTASTHSVTLHDDGNHGDGAERDAICTNSFSQTAQSGVYKFLFHSIGRNERGELAPREASRYVTLAQVEPTPEDDPGDRGTGRGTAVASYLIGSYDLREGRTRIYVTNPTGEELAVLVALFTGTESRSAASIAGCRPTVYSSCWSKLDPEALLGVVKVVSLDPEGRAPKLGLVGNQRIRHETGAGK